MCLFWLCATAALGLVHAGGPGSFFLPGHHDFMESSSAARLAKHYSGFVHKYAPELRAEFDAAREFKNATRTCRGEIGSVEASMLYVMIREFRPRRVLEVGALCGSSTRWLLAALKANGDGGTLTTFDLSSSAQRFVPAELHDHWMFRQQDVLAYIATPEGDALATSVDLVFMDAVHRNEFSARYTKEIFAKFTKPVPTFCHDIYNPLMMPPFRQCQKGLVLKVLDAELECIRGVISRENSRRGRHDFIYSPAQTSGEGAELTNWIARTGRAAGLVTFSPYAARDLALPLMETFERHSLHIDQINNPGCFFTVLPRSASIVPRRKRPSWLFNEPTL